MERYKPVQQKVCCLFEINVVKEPSEKRSYQPYRVEAGDSLHPRVTELLQANSEVVVSEKLDGTCVLIEEFQGKPWLWARHDRKPTKSADKRFKRFQNQIRTEENTNGEQLKFNWDLTKDFNSVPDHWVPAKGVELQDGTALPDSIGHTPGWVPVDVKARQHCWHLTSVDLDLGLALVLRENSDEEELVIDCVKLETLLGHTAELVGSMVNGNPYGLGNKQCPVHLLVIHGSISVTDPPTLTRDKMVDWFQENGAGEIEGIVWHFSSGDLFKIHRHHLGLKWPSSEVGLSKRVVTVSYNFSTRPQKDEKPNLFQHFSKIQGLRCGMLKNIHEHLYDISS